MRKRIVLAFAAWALGMGLAAAPVRPKTVCIDPGHPSENGSGARGKTLTEVGVAWSVAVLVRDKLERAGVRVVMTKQSVDEKVTNQRRAEIANKARADVMLRLHCDAGATRGFAVYYPDKVGTVGGATGPSKAVRETSATLAKTFHTELAARLKGSLPDRGLHTDGATLIGGKQGALTGSIYSEVPVLLVEMLVITNAEDEAFAKSPKGLETLSEALAQAVLRL
ncbi:MAG: N-acetylmuramoyl-L-alanine amidase [Fimbriimonadaceae bacterium]|nr:N-acetylmuramoyl-L-alanine amidase [Fimbriimonadaceae bacterium]